MSTEDPSPPPPAAVAPVEDCGPRLRELFPALFAASPKPIKLRIQSDIQARSPGVFTKPQLSAFLRRYTGSHAYLNALVKTSHRFDLDGNPGEEVSAEHRQAALEELARRRANHQARMALEAQQRANRATLLMEFGQTTLTPPNFAALKGIPAEELEPLLVRARQEAAEPPPDTRRRGPAGRPAMTGQRVEGEGRRESRVRPPGREDARAGPDRRPSPDSGGPVPVATPPARSPEALSGTSTRENGRVAAPGFPPRGRGPSGDRPPRPPRPLQPPQSNSGHRKARPEPRASGGPGAPAVRRDPRVEFMSPATRPPTAMAAALAAAQAAAATRQAPVAQAGTPQETVSEPSEERESGS